MRNNQRNFNAVASDDLAAPRLAKALALVSYRFWQQH
jgi:hypothetical protein